MISRDAAILFLVTTVMSVPGQEGGFDASNVTWAHAVNSQQQLQQALSSQISFLEADVTLGTVGGQQTVIMAHPPNSTSDISLDQWLTQVAPGAPEKGVKLDFKSAAALKEALPILAKHALPRQTWLNADILPGPLSYSPAAVDPESLLDLCKEIPSITISPGWTTSYPSSDPYSNRYSWQDVWTMARLINCLPFRRNCSKVISECHPTQSCSNITFPVRGIFVGDSVAQLQWLTSAVDMNSSLTVWSHASDPLDARTLLPARQTFPTSMIYYDLPGQQLEDFNRLKDTSVPAAYNASDPTLWGVLHADPEPFSCDYATIVSKGNHVVYGGSTKVAVVYGRLLTFPIQITGQFKPYELADYDGNYTEREGYMALVLSSSTSYWEDGVWINDDDISKMAVTFGVSDPTRGYSDCALAWKVTITNFSEPVQVSLTGNCSVDVTPPPIQSTQHSALSIGLIFEGNRAMVVESLSLEGQDIPHDGGKSSDKEGTGSQTSDSDCKFRPSSVLLVLLTSVLIAFVF